MQKAAIASGDGAARFLAAFRARDDGSVAAGAAVDVKLLGPGRVGRPFDWSEIVRQVQDGDGAAVVRAWVAAEAERAIGPTKAPMTAGRQRLSIWRPASR